MKDIFLFIDGYQLGEKKIEKESKAPGLIDSEIERIFKMLPPIIDESELKRRWEDRYMKSSPKYQELVKLLPLLSAAEETAHTAKAEISGCEYAANKLTSDCDEHTKQIPVKHDL
ncbi:hypothetical protein ADUPG1_012564 [Aduncisulcus paluster]|uniref:Uncharacterized protein n=1 Tax=Aduncisulcus paluster TaxID=2918883 RepID=A0ABQ5K1Z2_9EUKA|nr:hypothetical protein ADUPG1_012564 [Aduncisulcus paluster]